MEYLPHGDLQQYLKDDQSMPEEDSRHIIRQVLQGLAIMHREGFTHGDIKPKVRFRSQFHSEAPLCESDTYSMFICLEYPDQATGDGRRPAHLVD